MADDMSTLLKAASVRMETLTEKGLPFTRRKNADGYTYFINNPSDKVVNEWVTLSEKGATVAMFDAMTGNSGLANWKSNTNGTVDVMVQLQPYQSTIVRLYNTKKTGKNYPYTKSSGKPERIKGAWTVTFVNGGPALPATFTTSTLGSWTEQEGDAYKAFSGTAKYTISFTKPEGKSPAWLLDLGKVNETAEVMLNGKKIATLIGPNFNVVVDNEDLKATNTLEITVANLMANRIAYMDKNNIPWKKFYNTNMPARRRENSKNGLFDASAWTPFPSGLTGPVTLTPVSFNIK
jgi:hypothetical protein